MIRHLKILEFALAALMRRKARNLAVTAAFTVTVAALASIFFLTGSLKLEAAKLLGQAPGLIVQKTEAGRHGLIPLSYAERIAAISGVRSVRPRVWGYYYDSLTEANYTLMGTGPGGASLELLDGRLPAEPWEVAIGRGVAEARQVRNGEDLILVDGSNTGVSLEVVGTFEAASDLLTQDLVVFTEAGVSGFFRLPEGVATDMVVEVRNPNEVNTAAAKIKKALPDTRPITRSEILRTYEAVFNWRGGMMLAAFSGAVLSFSILAWDKATGVSADEKREIGILKAVGWDTGDVLALKFWEGAAIALFSFLTGTLLAAFNIAFLGGGPLAAVLKGWSVLFPAFDLALHAGRGEILALALATTGPYVAATLVPAWRTAVTDPESVIRS